MSDSQRFPVAAHTLAYLAHKGAFDAAAAEAGATVTRRQHTFDTHGEHLLILDNTGTLHVFEAAATGLEAKGSAEIYTGDQPAARIATSASADHAYVTDPAGRAIAVVDLEAVEVIDHVDLDFAPVGIAWLGVAEEAHDH